MFDFWYGVKVQGSCFPVFDLFKPYMYYEHIYSIYQDDHRDNR